MIIQDKYRCEHRVTPIETCRLTERSKQSGWGERREMVAAYPSEAPIFGLGSSEISDVLLILRLSIIGFEVVRTAFTKSNFNFVALE